jgi:hypothetical protein
MSNESVAKFDKVMADALKIKEQGNFVPDCSTKEGYEASKQFVTKVTTPARTALTNAHKDAKAYWLEGGRVVDAKKKELESLLLKIEAPHKEAYKAVDNEEKRIKAEKEAAIENGYLTLRSYSENALNQSSEYINNLIEECSCFDCDHEVYGKEIDGIIALHSKTMDQLTDAYTNALRYEDMQRKQAEIERQHAEMESARLKKEEEERQAEMREQMRIEAEENARKHQVEAEERARKAEIARVEYEERSKREAEEARLKAIKDAEEAAERARIQEIERQKAEKQREEAEAAAREADKKHRASINNQAMSALIGGGLSEDQAKLAVKLIASRKVPHIQIKY